MLQSALLLEHLVQFVGKLFVFTYLMPLVIVDVDAMELDDASVAIVDDILSWWIDYLKCHVVVAIVENLELLSVI